MKINNMVGLIFTALLGIGLSGCGDTWRGLKKDTRENLQAASEAIANAGEKLKEE
jgi:hypothetical protein